MSTEPSRIHLDPAAVNAILDAFVNKPGSVELTFADGRVRCRAAGMDLSVTSITVDTGGVDITLAFNDSTPDTADDTVAA